MILTYLELELYCVIFCIFLTNIISSTTGSIIHCYLEKVNKMINEKATDAGKFYTSNGTLSYH